MNKVKVYLTSLALLVLGVTPITLKTMQLDTLRILTIGDSITSRCGDNPPSGYCAELGALLDEAGIPHVFINRAVGGSDCGYTADNINSWLIIDQPNLVLLDCGTNNVPGNQASQDIMGTQWRTIVEATYVTGAKLGISFIGYSNADNNSSFHGSLLVTEGVANDVIYRNIQYYPHWFAGLADFQQMPGNLDYLDSGGIHPTNLGYATMARIWYRALMSTMNWPTIAPSCGMWGHRPPYGPPAFVPCTTKS